MFGHTKTILFIAIGLSLFSCSETSEGDFSYGNEIIGIASPITLDLDTTVVHLTDYFIHPETIFSLELQGLTVENDTVNHLAYLIGNLNQAMSSLSVKTPDSTYDIPVRASRKTEVLISIPSSKLEGENVAVKGQFNNWNPREGVMIRNGKNWEYRTIANNGTYEYKLVVDGVEKMDPENEELVPNGLGGWNNILQVGGLPVKNLLKSDSVDEGKIKMVADLKADEAWAFIDNHAVSVSCDGVNVIVEIPEWAREMEDAELRVWASSAEQLTNEVVVPLNQGLVVRDSKEIKREDMRKAIMYFVMVDRFFDKNSDNNFPIQDPNIHLKANNMGGDMLGITEKLKEGYFTELGVNTLWLSPITTNPDSAYGLWTKGLVSEFSGYHGYWPVRSKEIDYRFGSEESFRALISEAHGNEMNILLDYVANHVHVEHPVYQNHPDWATDLYLPDGTMNTEKWDEHRLTTWFDTHLATLDLTRPEVVNPMVDTAMYWLTDFELDGFRHDATKHIDELFWRTLSKRVKEEIVEKKGRSIYQVGETYGSPELISGYVESGQLDAQFDFNMYDAALDAFAKEETGFHNLERVLEESMKYYGAHHSMVNITGNQDKPRFASLADGSVKFNEDTKLAGWTRDIQNQGEEGFKRLRMMTAFLHAIPGIPCVYYGDEIGMPGGNDPDNRRMMVFEDLNSNQKKTKENLRNLTGIRNSSMPLIYGSTNVLEASKNMLRISRNYFDQEVQFIFYKGKEDLEFSIPLEQVPNHKVLGGEGVENRDDDDKTVFTMKPWSFVILETQSN